MVKPTLSLKENSRAKQTLKNGLVIAMAGHQTDSLVKFPDRTTLFVEDNYWDDNDSQRLARSWNRSYLAK